MTAHANRYGAEEPPPEFADRVVAAILAERRAAPRAATLGVKRLSFLALAAVLVGASAWAAYRAADGPVVAPALPPAETTSAPSPAVATPSEDARPPVVAPPAAAPPEPEPPPRRPPRQSVPAASSATAQPSASAPRQVHMPSCVCTAGIELCACVE
ncbi:MAG: hypothetical protein IT373_17915 [Polyangiaceae bacterium]|nr:hypothetical protein [Polyangiaceae bacterium]